MLFRLAMQLCAAAIFVVTGATPAASPEPTSAPPRIDVDPTTAPVADAPPAIRNPLDEATYARPLCRGIAGHRPRAGVQRIADDFRLRRFPSSRDPRLTMPASEPVTRSSRWMARQRPTVKALEMRSKARLR